MRDAGPLIAAVSYVLFICGYLFLFADRLLDRKSNRSE